MTDAETGPFHQDRPVKPGTGRGEVVRDRKAIGAVPAVFVAALGCGAPGASRSAFLRRNVASRCGLELIRK